MKAVKNTFQLIFLFAIIVFATEGCKKSCDDGRKNQKEEEIDCGGPCKPCADCNDGVQSGNETGVDCGGDCSPCPSIYEFQSVSSGTSSGLNKIDCDGSNCVAIGENGAVVISKDEGKTWSSVDAGTSEKLNSVALIGSTIFICGEKGVLKKSTDLGQTFSELSVPNREDINWKDLLFYDANNGVVCGSKLSISYTTDGGENWENAKHTFDSQRSFYSLSSPASNATYVVGEFSVQLSSDQGASWTQITLSDKNPDIKEVTDVHYISSGRAFLAGASNILFTANSIEWYDKALYAKYGGFSFIGKTGLYAGRDVNNQKAKILETLDSGITWKQLPLLNEDVRFNDCFIIDASNAIIIGEGGNILRR